MRENHGYGSSRNKTYSAWQALRQRCSNPNHSSYSNYGGRGIKVCERWDTSFEAFLEDMGEIPDRWTVDRIDSNGDYEPDNCQYASRQTQALNRRVNVAVIIQGRSFQTLRQAAEWSGVKYGTVRVRVTTYKWTVERALTTPIDTRFRRKSS